MSAWPSRSWVSPPRLRTFEDEEGERRATPLELFFDLVFVVVVSQVARRLAADHDADGFARFAGLFAPALWAWMGFTFYANRFDTDDAIYRVMKMLAMLGMAALAVNVPHATTEHGSVGFAIAYVSVRAVLLAMYVRAWRHVTGAARALTTRYLVGFSLGAGLWLVSLAVPPPGRFALWAAGLALDLLMPPLGWRLVRRAPVNVPHITERFGLFFIIVLGESIIGVVSGVAGISFSVTTGLVCATGFTVAACLWWVYFDFADTSVVGRGLLGLVYMYGHFVLLAGVAAVGVGTELAIHGAGGGHHVEAGTRWALAGGVVAFLLALAIFHVAAEWTSPRDPALLARLALAAVAVVLGLAGGGLTPLAFVSALAVGLVALLVVEATTFPEGAASVYEPAPS